MLYLDVLNQFKQKYNGNINHWWFISTSWQTFESNLSTEISSNIKKLNTNEKD